MSVVKDTDWALMRHDVDNWARQNASDDFHYGSPQSYWRAALNAGIINQEQYEYARNHYGTLWNYRGD